MFKFWSLSRELFIFCWNEAGKGDDSHSYQAAFHNEVSAEKGHSQADY